MEPAGVAPQRVETTREPVQIAAVAQDFAGVFPAALFCTAALHLAELLSRRRNGDSSARAGAPLL